ncbi:MAG: molecular chaperone [Desulfuromonas sp.]|uniref:Hsp20/alpha crystallin family protein n=1 Tax=Desulfuromonas sp. TaxID=892 RepID=UPI000CBE2E02|nr:Hsp20/alpha crystallin family protein [Desulfuromonas sp.]PLX83335.1 MAG: molecular chaperone [Desulfuromonas sp.]
MALDIFREMENLRREIDGAFRGLGLGRLMEPSFLPGPSTLGYPQINSSQDENNLYIAALVPGIEPKDLELTVIRGVLTLSGERKGSSQENKTWHRRERGLGKFMRTVELPCEVNAERVSAEYRNGVLTVTLPKHEAERPKKISVTAQ